MASPAPSTAGHLRRFLIGACLLLFSSIALAVPAAPSNLRASVFANTSFTLIWDDNSTDETDFEVIFVDNGGTPQTFTLSSGNPSTTGTLSIDLTAANLGIAYNHSYRFNIRSHNASGFSAYTTEITVNTVDFGTPMAMKATAMPDAAVLLQWVDNAVLETGYLIEGRVLPNGTFANIASTSANFSAGLVGGLVPNTSYEFRLRAYKNVSGTITTTAPSTALSATTTAMTPPTSLAATAAADGKINLTWLDNSSDEMGYALYFKKATDSTYTLYNYTAANATSASLIGLAPGTAYNFQVACAFQASQSDPIVESARSNTANATTTATLLAPTGLVVTSMAPAETSVSFAFSDNTAVNSGYEIEYCLSGSGAFVFFGDAGDSATISAAGAVSPGTAYDFRLRAFYQEGSNPRVYSGYSNVASYTTPFNAPTALTATVASQTQVNLSWTDNSLTEGGVAIYYRPTGGTYSLFDYATANATTFSVTGLTAGTAYEFQVAAAYQRSVPGTAAVVESARSNTATSTTKDGFTSPPFVTFGTNNAYTYQATTSTASARTAWNAASGLPAGMSFSTSTGAITGTPTEYGLFTVTLSATFADGWTSTFPIKLRIPRPPAAPTVVTTLPATQTFTTGDSEATIPLAGKFADTDTESAVRLVTSRGTVDVLLYPAETPTTVTNFLGYVNRGDYNNSAFHRISDIASSGVAVLQGGQIKPSVSGPAAFTAITAQSAIQNEPGISNLNYTIAMAKTSNPDSATKEFYFNLTDADTVLDSPSLSGGFTVFGRVSETSKANLTAMSNAPTGGPYDTLVDNVATNTGFKWPMDVASSADVPATMDNTKVMKIISATALSQFITLSATSSAPGVATASVSGTDLIITPVAGGATSVTVTATDLDGMTATQTINVAVNQAPAFTSVVPTSTGVVNSAYSFTCTASGFPLPTFSVTAGTLPSGLSLVDGVISGTPTAVGTFTGTITASNGIGSAATQNFSIVINQVPAFTSSAPTSTGATGSAYSFTCTASGSPAPTFTVTAGSLPTGLTLASNGAITGTPTVAGIFTGTISADNGTGSAVTQDFSITINATLAGWAANKGLTGSDAQWNADPDHDGRTNLQEFAFMTEPSVSNASTVPSYNLAAPGASKYGEITFPVLKFAPSLTYTVEVSDSLTTGTWTPLWTSSDGFAASVVTSAVDHTDHTVLTVRDTQASPPATRRFMRVTVTTP